MPKRIFCLSAVALLAVNVCVSSRAQSAAAGGEAGLKQTLREMFDAAEHEDQARWLELTTADFRAFENGRSYDRTSFLDLIKQAHAKGVHFSWSVTQAQSRNDDQLGMLNYVNSGTIHQSGGDQYVKWLETAAFQRDHGRWRSFFIESARTDDPPH